MKKAILGKKLGMTQIFTSEGLVVPVTVVEAGPCYVVQKKTKEKDGYNAIVVAFNQTRENLLNKPQLGILKKANVQPKRMLKEFRFEDTSKYSVGQDIKCDIFADGEKVDATADSRGRGYTGSIYRWNMHHQKNTHGGYKVHRRQSLGSGPGICKVYKGKKMSGRYGGTQITIQNLEVVRVDSERNLILVKGAIPGPRNGVVMLRNAVKA